MNSETTMIFMQYRIQEWIAHIRDCWNCFAGISGAINDANRGLVIGTYDNKKIGFWNDII